MKVFILLLIEIVFSHIAVKDYNTNKLITTIYIESHQIETTKELTLLISSELINNHNYNKHSKFEFLLPGNKTIIQNEEILLGDIEFNPYQDDHQIIYVKVLDSFPLSLVYIHSHKIFCRFTYYFLFIKFLFHRNEP